MCNLRCESLRKSRVQFSDPFLSECDLCSTSVILVLFSSSIHLGLRCLIELKVPLWLLLKVPELIKIIREGLWSIFLQSDYYSEARRKELFDVVSFCCSSSSEPKFDTGKRIGNFWYVVWQMDNLRIPYWSCGLCIWLTID